MKGQAIVTRIKNRYGIADYAVDGKQYGTAHKSET